MIKRREKKRGSRGKKKKSKRKKEKEEGNLTIFKSIKVKIMSCIFFFIC